MADTNATTEKGRQLTDSPRKVGIARHPPKLTTKTAHFALQHRPRDTVG